MSDTLFRIVSPFGIRWLPVFRTEEAAWSRILGVKRLADNPDNRAAILREGWKIVEVTSVNGMRIG